MASLSKALKPMIKKALIQGGGYLGGASANAAGMPAASVTMSAFGRNLGARISRLIGSGDYASNSVSANSLIHPKGLSANSAFSSSGANTIRIRHREFLGDIQTSQTAGNFLNQSYPINPGLSNSFPFLSSLAVNFDQYVFHGLVYEFISTTGSSTTGNLGTVILSGDYNPSDTPYSNKVTMENSGHAISAKLDTNAMYGFECATADNPMNGYFIRQGTTTDVMTHDIGTFQIATAPSPGLGASAVVGELWVTYDVELKRPQLSPNRYGYYHGVRYNTSATNPLGLTASGASEINAYGNTFAFSVSGTTITFSKVNTGDIYKVDIYWSGVTAGVLAYPVPSVGGMGLVGNTWGDHTVNSLVVPVAGTSSTSAHMSMYLAITANDNINPIIQFGTTSTLPSGLGNNCEIVISCVGNGYTAAQI